MKVLHLLGATEDNGGILSTLRALDGAVPGMTSAVWVNEAFVETRQPRLDYRRSKHALDESGNHLLLAWRAWRSFAQLRVLLQREPFDLLHAHSRGCFAVALLAAARLDLPVVFTNHTYARRIGLYRWGARRPGLTTVLLTPNMARHYGLSPEPGRVELIGKILTLIQSPGAQLAAALLGAGGRISGQVKSLAEKEDETPAA